MHVARSQAAPHHTERAPVVIGLVNTMPAAALRATEMQFATLLREAVASLPFTFEVQLRCFAPRPVGDRRYRSMDHLWRTDLDGLIVTGSPPEADAIADEPVLPLIRKLANWAAGHRTAAIWSCLAAHAVTYHLDGLQRRRLPAKLSGVYACEDATDTAASGPAMRFPVPHSRFNDLDAEALVRAGYRILSRGPGMAAAAAQIAGSPADIIVDGVDCFERSVDGGRFLMLQGHPEYGATTLMREYRRDVRQALMDQAAAWPAIPLGVFDPATRAALAELQARASSLDPADAMAALELALHVPSEAPWKPAGIALFAQWLAGLRREQVQLPVAQRLSS